MTSDRRGLNRRQLLKRGMAAALVTGIPAALFAEALATLDVASAGSIRPMLEGPLKTAATRALKLDLHTHAKGADAVAQSIVDGSLHADVFIPVTAGPMLTVMRAGMAETAYPVGSTEMVLVYSPKGRFASQFEAAAKGNGKWWEILQQPGLRFAHGNPAGDPGGRNAIFTMMLAAKKYNQPDLVKKLFGPTFTPPPAAPGSNNHERLLSGDLDAATSYQIATPWAHLPFIDLPADINLSGQNVHAEHPDVSLTLGDKTFYPEPRSTTPRSSKALPIRRAPSLLPNGCRATKPRLSFAATNTVRHVAHRRFTHKQQTRLKQEERRHVIAPPESAGSSGHLRHCRTARNQRYLPLRSSMYRLSLRPAGILRSLFSLVLLSVALPLLAQSGQISGVVKDPSQLVVPNAQMTLTNTQTNTQATASALTNQQGVYLFTGIAPGTYRLTAQGNGFNTIVIPQMVIEAGQNATQDFTFHLGAATETITVSATAPGSAESGYRVDNVAPGVLGTAPIINTPYVISVLSSNLIANTQTKSLRDSIKYLPLVSFQEQQGSEVIRPETRGIEGSNMQNTRMDGMGISITSANAMEQYQQLEVVNGLGASMYGPANPSGMFNFILKRPTEERFTNLSLDYDNKSIGTIYGDTGGRLGPHKIFGYRANLLYGDGTSYVEASRLRRRLAEFAFDVRPTNATLIDAHYSAYDIVQRGFPGWFTYGPNKSDKTNVPPHTLILPAAPDPTRVGYGQAYAGVNLTTQSASARLHHDFSSNWHAEAGGLWQRLDRFIDTPVNNITDNNGDYSSSLANGFAPRFGVNSDLGYITGTVKALGMKHDLVIGSTGYEFTSYSGTKATAASLLLGTANISAPSVFAAPAVFPRNINLYHSSIINQQGFNLGDFITLPAHFLVRLAASQDWIGVDNFKSASLRSGGSNKNGVSPSVSILYKPLENMTFYGTYASSLQQGDTAPAGAVNANQALAPYRSKEWEIGYKSQVHTIALTTALFRIERPFANTDASNVFRITGDQVNYGAEISAQGNLFHRLLIDGGFTALNPRLNDTGIAATNGKLFVGTPSYKSNILSEYRLPFLEGLIVTGDWQFIGRRPQDDENLHFTNGYNTFDFGMRYSHRVLSKLTTWRVAANNITATRYYSTLGPGDITGTNASSNTAHLGEPRTVAASMQIAF